MLLMPVYKEMCLCIAIYQLSTQNISLGIADTEAVYNLRLILKILL